MPQNCWIPTSTFSNSVTRLWEMCFHVCSSLNLPAMFLQKFLFFTVFFSYHTLVFFLLLVKCVVFNSRQGCFMFLNTPYKREHLFSHLRTCSETKAYTCGWVHVLWFLLICQMYIYTHVGVIINSVLRLISRPNSLCQKGEMLHFLKCKTQMCLQIRLRESQMMHFMTW